MASRDFQPSLVRDEPKINKCHPTQSGHPCTPMMENHGDILVRGLWERGTDCILDIRFTETSSPTYQMKDPIKVLEASERLKKNKLLQPCLNQRRQCTPFIVSVDGLIGKETKMVLKVLAEITATKAVKMYSNGMGYMRARMSLAIVRATHVCLRGSRFPTSRMSNIHPQWEDTAGMTSSHINQKVFMN
jgi:hypothetical protein